MSNREMRQMHEYRIYHYNDVKNGLNWLEDNWRTDGDIFVKARAEGRHGHQFSIGNLHYILKYIREKEYELLPND